MVGGFVGAVNGHSLFALALTVEGASRQQTAFVIGIWAGIRKDMARAVYLSRTALVLLNSVVYSLTEVNPFAEDAGRSDIRFAECCVAVTVCRMRGRGSCPVPIAFCAMRLQAPSS